MKQAVATRSFIRSDVKQRVRVGERIIGAPDYIDDLARIEMVREVQAHQAAPELQGDPSPAAGEDSMSSASQAAPASPQPTSTMSKRGGKRRRRGVE